MFFFFNDTATTEIYTLSLHDALPIFPQQALADAQQAPVVALHQNLERRDVAAPEDRKSTRLNSSHGCISYAVFCLKKKKKYTSRHAGQKSSKSDYTLPLARS